MQCKTAIKNMLVAFEECAEEGKMLRLSEKISKISSYAAALGTAHWAQCEEDAEPIFEDRAAASSEFAEGVRKDTVKHARAKQTAAQSLKVSSQSKPTVIYRQQCLLSWTAGKAAAVAEVESPVAGRRRGRGSGREGSNFPFSGGWARNSSDS